MKKKIVSIFIMLFIALLLFGFVLQRVGTREIWDTLLSFSRFGIFWVLFLLALSNIIGILRWQTILKDKGHHFKFKYLVSPWLIGVGVSYFTPFAFLGGESARGYVLKKEKEITWSKGMITILIDKILEGTTSFIIIFLGLSFFIVQALTIPARVWGLFSLLLFPIVIIIIFYIKAFRSESMAGIIAWPLKKFFNHKAKGIFAAEQEVFSFFKLHNKNLKKAIALAVMRQIVDFLRFWAIIFFLGAHVNFFQAFSIISFIYIAYYIVPVPAALGVLELSQAFAFTQLGFTSELAIAFTLIVRSFDTVFSLGGFVFGFRFIGGWIKDKLFER
jgi:uncharacterized protein (TIRG00374 family)